MDASAVDRSRTAPFVPATAKPTDHDLTVIVPAYNEELRLPATLAGLKQPLDEWGLDYQVLVVDDGSTDRTAELTDQYDHRFSTLRLPQQSGKGAAVRAGMLLATGRIMAFTDADLPYELTALRQGYEWIRDDDCDVVLGARDVDEAECRAKRRLLRTIATSVFRGVVKTLISRNITDTQCGLKLFSRDAALALFSRSRVDGFAFDAEIVFLAERMGIPCRRVPATLINEYSSTLSLSRHALPMLLDVLHVRRRELLGTYGPRGGWTSTPPDLTPVPKTKKAA
jgi:dolichyl-phosphate beta-glucosyltransferase